MTIPAVTLLNGQFTFPSNLPNDSCSRCEGNKEKSEFERFSASGYGLFRLQKLVKDALEFAGEMAKLVGNTTISVAVTPYAAVIGGFANATILGHTINTVRPAWKAITESTDAFSKGLSCVKKVGDFAVALIYSVVGFSSAFALSSPFVKALVSHATLLTLAADCSELWTESGKMYRIDVLTASPKELSNTYKDEQTKVIAEERRLQIIKLAKVVVSVAAGLVFLAGIVVPLVTGAVLNATMLSVVAVSGAFFSSVLAVTAHFYEASMENRLKFTPNAPENVEHQS